jgi:hypothetical protein
MASSLIQSAFGNTSFTAVNELTGIACWKDIKVKDVEVDSSALNTNNPITVEQATERSSLTSLLSADINTLKIIQPSMMRITCFCIDLSSIESIVNVFNDTQTTLTITTKGITANNMAVITVDIDQTPEMTSAAKVVIELEQTAPAPTGSLFYPSQSSDESSLGVSVQTPPSAVTSATGLYNMVSKFIGSL